MDDVPKIPYLVGKPGNQKFKRNVPHDIVEAAGKTAWVERLKSNAASKIKDQGHLFALRTNGEIVRLRASIKGAQKAQEEAGAFDLDEVAARQLAFSYFERRHQSNIDNGNYIADPEDPNYEAILADAVEEYRHARRRASGTERYDDPGARKLLLEYGYLTEEQSKSIKKNGWPKEIAESRAFQSLCRRIEQADLELARILNESLYTDTVVKPQYPEPGFVKIGQPVGSPKTSSGLSLGDLIKKFLSAKEQEVTTSRFSQYQIPRRALEEQLGAKRDLASITRDEARTLSEFLPSIPAYASRHYGGLSLAKAAERYRKNNGHYPERWEEGQKHLSVIMQMFGFAVDEGYLERNPFAGLKIKPPRNERKKHRQGKTPYEPFTSEELNRLFAQPLFSKKDAGWEDGALHHYYWAPIVGLFTGCRMNEILQLETVDVVEVDGIKLLQITDEDFGTEPPENERKRLKTKSALRRVPIHPRLIELGFWDQAKRCKAGRLFPLAKSGSFEKPSDLYSRRFNYLTRQAGIWVNRTKVFHSFRHTFNDALRAADVPREIRVEIMGWSEGGDMDRRYGSGHPVATLADALAKVSYPGVLIPKPPAS